MVAPAITVRVLARSSVALVRSELGLGVFIILEPFKGIRDWGLETTPRVFRGSR
jgi:hypothetical protein